MANGDSPTGKMRALADKASSPSAVLTSIAGMLATIITVGGWAVLEIKASDAKADSALTTAKEVKAGVDMFIKLQEEANQLKREEMQFQGMQVKTRSVSTSSSSSETSSSIESAVREVSVRTSSGIVVIEYKPDSLRNGVIRKGDSMWVPIVDTTGNRPR